MWYGRDHLPAAVVEALNGTISAHLRGCCRRAPPLWRGELCQPQRPAWPGAPVPACPGPPTRSGRRWPGLRLPAAWWGRISQPVPSGKVTVCWCSAAGRAAALRTVPAGRTLPSGCWISFGARRQTSLRLRGTGFLPLRRAAKKDVLPGPQPRRHPCAGVHDAAGAGSCCGGGVKYTNGNFYALPEQLHTLLTEHVPRPGGHGDRSLLRNAGEGLFF